MNESFPRHESSISFPVDYSSILERISQIDPVHYGKTRNFIDGAVTYLSPYISRGVISGKQVQDSVLAKGHLPLAIEKFLQELAWREYFQRVWQVKSEALFADMKQTQAEVIHQQMTSAVADASTGITAIGTFSEKNRIRAAPPNNVNTGAPRDVAARIKITEGHRMAV